MTLISQVPGRLATARVKIRENIATLSPDKLGKFRAALAQFVQRTDTQGYEFYAGWHGVPLGLCEHHNEYFLPWHRGYLYYFELALQQFDPDVTLPWWDWMSDGGVPDAYDAENVDGDANVLHDAPIAPIGAQLPPDVPDRTVRDVGGAGPAAVPPPLGQYNDWLMEPASYTEFNRRMWMLHDNVHVWVGGSMSDPQWAAFDPLFWAHHTMVDRLWRIWQHNTSVAPPQNVQDAAMVYPQRFAALRGRDVNSVRQLGYEYAGITDSVPGAP